MPLFESFSEIIASLTPRRPRRGLPDDRQRSDAQHRHSVTQHEASLNPRRRSRSPFSRASRRINTVQAEFSLGSEPDNDRLSEPRSSSTTRHTAAHLQVRDTQELYAASLHFRLLCFHFGSPISRQVWSWVPLSRWDSWFCNLPPADCSPQ